MSLMLIRHAQSEHHIKDITGGWTDVALTELGRRQAASLAARLKRELAGVDVHIYTSDFKRASQTAAMIGAALGIEPTPVPCLREYNNGMAAGKTKAEAEAFARPLQGAILDWQPYPEAETWREFYIRTTTCVEGLVEKHEEPVLIVTHQGTIINTIVWWLQLGMGALSKVSFHTAPASISVLKFNEWKELAIERLNDIGHLYADGLVEAVCYF